MTAKEIQRRNKKAEQLRVLQAEDGSFYVESEKGKILYNVVLDDQETSCTCGDFAKNIKKDPNFSCKHILSVMNAIPRKDIENATFLEKSVPKLDERFITNIKGKDFAVYAGVLDLATQKGLLKLEVDLLQYPTKENGMEAICRAVAESKSGEVFADIGDANPKNCHEMIVKHLIRMASTRAKGRALRDMCNIGIACVEELADFDDVIGGETAKPKPKTKRKTSKKTQAAPAKDNSGKSDNSGKGKSKGNGAAEPKSEKPKKSSGATHPKMSEAQKRAIYNLSRRRGISVEELEQMAMETYGVEVENLSSKDASSFIRSLQQAA